MVFGIARISVLAGSLHLSAGYVAEDQLLSMEPS